MESVHGIGGTIIVIIGTIIMIPMDLLTRKDLKSINYKLLIFLTAAFSIGNVLKASGASEIIFTRFVNMFPKEFNTYYIFLIFLTSVGLHMVLGSNMTTLSVVVPGIVAIASGITSIEVVIFLIYFSVCAHYVLPFHNVIMMIGDGNRHYRTETILKFSPFLTLIIVASIFFIYINWWKFAGFL
jgi:di/tricarboxylate transporter